MSMSHPISFTIEKKLKHPHGTSLGRAGVLSTPHGEIKTPAFVAVGTKATVKSLTPEQVRELGAQVVLANTYHLYLEPGDERIAQAGGLHAFMHWSGPTMTDSGGFQAFSLGAAFGKGVSKVVQGDIGGESDDTQDAGALAAVTEDGVTFKSFIDGSSHTFTPEKSMEIQHRIGADIMFAFDECTSPVASYEYQKQALERTHRWASRSLAYHQAQPARERQALYGIVQGGRHKDLREISAATIGAMDFDGFGIGGSFEKEDLDTAVGWVNAKLPEGKPRHLLGIGEPADLFGAVEQGCDTFDCVAPTRIARNGGLYTASGRINILNARFRDDKGPIDEGCGCYTCTHYTRAYVAHLFHAKEMLASTLASIHNLYFIVHLVERMRQSIIDDTFYDFKEAFLKKYQKQDQ
jgi:queuine tRNA-ribosyltransferase